MDAESTGKSEELSDQRRCLVIDAQPTVRLGIRGLLDDRYEIEEAEDFHRAVEMLNAVDGFDVAVVEMSRPAKGDGEEGSSTAAIRALRKARSGLGIVAHAPSAERRAVTEAIDAGANAFVAKSSPAAALSRAVDAAADSEPFIDPAADGAAGRDGTALTRRQRQILQLFADGHATAEIAVRLGVSAETVRTHAKGILARLSARDRTHAVAKGLRGGLIV